MYKEERNPFFSVRKETIKTESGLSIPKVALINDETDDILGLVSENYELLPNSNINSLFDEALDGLEVKEVHDHLDATTRRWRRRIIFGEDSFNFEVLPDDSVGLLLEIFNGYDARTAFGYELMGYRSICENGQVLGRKSFFRESYAHYVDNPERLRLSVDSKLDAFQENVLTWSGWAEIGFNQADFDAFVDGREYLGKKVGEAVKDAYEPTMNSQKLNEDKYGAYNVLTFLATHETKARNGSNVFSSRFNTINRMAGDLYGYDERALVVNGE